jgi:hypothetical protein
MVGALVEFFISVSDGFFSIRAISDITAMEICI